MTVHDLNAAGATVRQAEPRDVSTIAEFNMAMAKETEGIDLDRDTVLAGVSAILQDEAKGRYYVVEVGGQEVAQLMITLEWSDWRNAQVWWIQSVYVRLEHRRRGYYRLLYAHVKEAAQREGAAGLRLYADNSNKRAQAAYQALGMTSHYTVFEHMFTGF